jgi:hypothetical protein
MSNCLSCARGFHETCRGVCDCTHEIKMAIVEIVSDGNYAEPDKRSRSLKRDGALKDASSTGRKRAAVMYPLDREADCEWANKEEAGGGITIKGCGIRIDPKTKEVIPIGKQSNRHHGPDYNTLNNDDGNVHRICARCHNSWHAVNDSEKDNNYLTRYGHAAGGTKFKGSKHHSDKNED